MLKEPALSLHAAGLKDLCLWCSPATPVAPKLLRDRAEDRLGVGGLPCAATNAAAAIIFIIGFFLFLDQAAFLHFGAVETPSYGILTAFAAMSRPGHFRLKITCKF